jgi:hypothetical protein
MPSSKKSAGKKPTQDPVVIAIDEAKKIATDLKEIAAQAKKKFDRADDKTKKAIIAGVAGAVAILTAMHKVKVMRRKSQAKKAAKKKVM